MIWGTSAGESKLVHRAGARATRISARSARRRRGGRSARALCRDGKHGKLWLEFGAMAFGAVGFLLTIDQCLKFMRALFTLILKDGHRQAPERRSNSQLLSLLEINRDHFAIAA